LKLINKTANICRRIASYKSADKYSLISYYQFIIKEFITLKILTKAILNLAQLDNKKLEAFGSCFFYILSNYYYKYNCILLIKVSIIKSFIFKKIPKVFIGFF